MGDVLLSIDRLEAERKQLKKDELMAIQDRNRDREEKQMGKLELLQSALKRLEAVSNKKTKNETEMAECQGLRAMHLAEVKRLKKKEFIFLKKFI